MSTPIQRKLKAFVERYRTQADAPAVVELRATEAIFLLARMEMLEKNQKPHLSLVKSEPPPGVLWWQHEFRGAFGSSDDLVCGCGLSKQEHVTGPGSDP